MRGNHVLKVVAHATPPLSPQPGFRQYDFFVNGQSFFTFPKVFRLGLAPNDPKGFGPPPGYHPSGPVTGHAYDMGLPSERGYRSTSRSDNIAAIEAPHDREEEEAYLKEAIKLSLEVNTKSGGAPAAAQQNTESNLLLDFFEEPAAPAPAPVPALPAPADASGYAAAYSVGYTAQSSAPSQSFLALPAPVPPAYPASQSVPQQSYGEAFSAAPTQGYGAPAPPPAYSSFVDPYAAPPTDPFSQQQPPAYGYPATPSNVNVAPSQATPSSLGFASPPPAESFAFPAYEAPVPAFAAAPEPAPAAPFFTNPPAPAPESSAPATGSLADQAYFKFANMDKFDLVSKKDEKKVNPFESTTIGPQPSLADMKMMQNKVRRKQGRGIELSPVQTYFINLMRVASHRGQRNPS